MIRFLLGFSLIELLIVISLISILTALSMPLYSFYFTKAHRMEAITSLSKLALILEQYHLEKGTYQNATLGDLHFPDLVAHQTYRLSIDSATEQNYLISATPLGAQAKNDKICACLSLNAYGEKIITGTGSLTDCW